MKHTYISQEISDFGNRVVCDICNKDWTGSPVSGGFLVGSYAYCPDCAPQGLADLKRYNEIRFITAYCPKDMSYADWCLKLRAGDNRVIITYKETKDE
jgi:hypothetical protein